MQRATQKIRSNNKASERKAKNKRKWEVKAAERKEEKRARKGTQPTGAPLHTTEKKHQQLLAEGRAATTISLRSPASP